MWNWLVICPVFCQFVPYALLSQKNEHFSLGHVREGQRTVVSSVQVAVVVSLSVPHQHCDKFHKILQDNAKWTGAVILYVVLLYLFAL